VRGNGGRGFGETATIPSEARRISSREVVFHRTERSDQITRGGGILKIEAALFQRVRRLLPIACVDVVITSGDRFLLCRRTEQPAQGQWWFPGGRVLFGETLLEACIRKSREEVGLVVEPGEIVSVEESVFDDPRVHTINTVIHAKLVGSTDQVELDETQSEYRWMSSAPTGLHPCVASPLAKLGFPTTDARDS